MLHSLIGYAVLQFFCKKTNKQKKSCISFISNIWDCWNLPGDCKLSFFLSFSGQNCLNNVWSIFLGFNPPKVGYKKKRQRSLRMRVYWSQHWCVPASRKSIKDLATQAPPAGVRDDVQSLTHRVRHSGPAGRAGTEARAAGPVRLLWLYRGEPIRAAPDSDVTAVQQRQFVYVSIRKGARGSLHAAASVELFLSGWRTSGAPGSCSPETPPNTSAIRFLFLETISKDNNIWNTRLTDKMARN